MIKKYEKLLKSPVFVSREEINVIAIPQAESIHSKHATRNGRDLEMILRDTIPGTAMELAAAKALNGKLNDAQFNPGVPMSYIYDVEAEDQALFEIKTSPQEDKWLNFNIKGFGRPKGKRADYSVFTKYNENLDYLLTGYYDIVPEGFIVKFKFLIDSVSFKNYMAESKSGGMTTHYYNVPQASRDGVCIKLD